MQRVAGRRTSTSSQMSQPPTLRPDAPDFQQAGELKGDDMAKAVRVLDVRGVPGDKSRVERIKRTDSG